MQTRISTGREITYEDVGQGPTLILLHGPFLNRLMWQPQFEELAKDYRLLAPDLPALAGPDNLSTSLEEMADDVMGLLDALEVRARVVLVGISVCGNIALAFARKYASRLRGLVLADTGGGLYVSEETRLMYDRIIDFLHGHSVAEVVEVVLPRLLSAAGVAKSPHLAQQVREIAVGQSATAAWRLIQAMRDAPQGFAPLGRDDLPILVVVGSADQLIGPSVAESLAAALGGAQLIRIREAGHFSNLEKPDAFNQALRTFLEGLGPV